MLGRNLQYSLNKKSFSSLNVVVIGGSRGLGLGFVEDYLSQGHKVLATYRDNGRAEGLMALKKTYPHTLKLSELEIRDYEAIKRLNEKFETTIDILIVNAGIMLCPSGSQPLTETVDEMRQTFEVNTFAPDQIMRELFPKLLNTHSCAVYLSSTLSSFADNYKGRYQSYRASKAAGNIIFQNWNIQLAKEWLEKDGGVDERPCAFAISPGVVQTDMGGPTSPLTVKESVSGMVKVIAEVRKNKHSSLYLYDGSILQQFPVPEIIRSKINDLELLAPKF
ncbi:MAG: SDR family NAD(P)-dependent oxidoreductase [Tatlockia sp.]|nr:SDR family NAD(P)-dependent oxidoreductase [Tatlockia sp.]